MNDRLKFRFWDKKEKEYFTCGDIDHKSGIFKTYPYRTYNWCFGHKNIVAEQCTGLKDKNGQLIYEGDIVKITDKSSRKEPFIGVVEYTNTASFETNCNGLYMYLHNPKTPENISMVEKKFCTSLREIEVIGNIHENKELLK